MIKSVSIAAISIVCLINFNCSAQLPDAKKIQQHIKILASDSLEGRGTGTAGGILALNYIQQQFKQLGLEPKGDGKLYTQKFSFKAGQEIVLKVGKKKFAKLRIT